jgi:hypothetical protein
VDVLLGVGAVRLIIHSVKELDETMKRLFDQGVKPVDMVVVYTPLITGREQWSIYIQTDRSDKRIWSRCAICNGHRFEHDKDGIALQPHKHTYKGKEIG